MKNLKRFAVAFGMVAFLAGANLTANAKELEGPKDPCRLGSLIGMNCPPNGGSLCCGFDS